MAAIAVAAPAVPASSQPEKVTRVIDHEVAMASDNRRLAFISNRDGRFKLYIMSLDGSGLKRITDDPGTDDNPAWSPDGRRIAYVSDKSGDNDIYVRAVDGSAGSRPLVKRPGADLHPNWSPDGRRLLFTSLRNSRGPDRPQLDLYVINADGTGERQLTAGPITSYASWSPDGSRMVYWRMFNGNADIVLADGTGRAVKRLTSDPAFDGWPAWAPDGNSIVFARERGEEADIYVVGTNGRERLVAGGRGRKTGPRWSADGKWIYFSLADQREARIWRIAAPAELIES